MDDAPEGYELSTREELAPLVRDFHEMVGRDLTNSELLALDFALEWTFEVAEAEADKAVQKILKKLEPEYAVTYGIIPTIKLIEIPSLDAARRVATALNGQVRVRTVGKWELYKATE